MPINELLEKQKQLMEQVPHGHTIRSDQQAIVVAACGVIEETMEYLNSIGFKSWRPNPLPEKDQLEEITDVLFFYLELIILSGFTWSQIETEYHRKHAVNLKRYEDGKKGDYSWDDRETKQEL